jgi:tetratricopeptide (TPR) repeat protein
VLISIDGFDADRLPVYGGSGTDTPAIDGLADDAIVFERAYTHSPQTLPAHASMLSGQLPFEHGVRDDAGFVLKADARTLAELLRNRGFSTGAVVSSFLLRRESGLAQGFSFFDADLPEEPGEHGSSIERDGALVAESAERWIRMQGSQRFFLFVEVGGVSADMVVARLVQALKQRRLYDGATMVLTADRGDGPAPAVLDEAPLRVPLLVKQPRLDGAGRRIASSVQLIDIVPTVLDLVRAPIPSGLRGRSLRRVLDNEDAVLVDQPIYAESLAAHFRIGGQPVFALTRGRFRYVRGGDEALVEIGQSDTSAADPGSPEFARLRSELDRLLNKRTFHVPADVAAADEDRLAALGYLPGSRLAAAQGVNLAPSAEASLIRAHRDAALLVGEKQYAAAIDRLRAIAREHPALAVIQYQLGRLFDRTGRVDDAISAYRAAATLQPDAPDIPIALAAALTRARKYDEAREVAALAVALAERTEPDALGTAHEAAARVALARRDLDDAVAHAEAAQKADPGLPLSKYVEGQQAYDEGRYEAALKAFEEAEAVLKPPGRTLEDLHLSLGDTLARLDRYADAEMQFREELRAFPHNVRAYSSLAMLYRASNRDRGVEEVIDELVEAAPTPEGYAIAARLWTILGDRPRAQALRADARARFRGDPSLALLDRH